MDRSVAWYSAELQQSGTALDFFLGCHLKEGAYFFVQLTVDLFPSE
jgi:hypothetical protein